MLPAALVPQPNPAAATAPYKSEIGSAQMRLLSQAAAFVATRPLGHLRMFAGPETISATELRRPLTGQEGHELLRITYERVARRMTLAQLAELAGITSAHLCNIEQGYATPSGRVLAAMAKALGVTPPEVLLRPVVIQEAAVGTTPRGAEL